MRVFSLIDKPLQSVGMSPFESLEHGDIVFIDSTHVAKTGSDVEWLFRELIPSLSVGVLVHFHDIFYPFEYPAEWVLYLFPNFLTYKAPAVIAELCPRMLADPGASIWLRRVR